MSGTEATANYHLFTSAVYLTPIFGALLSDIFLGKYLPSLSQHRLPPRPWRTRADGGGGGHQLMDAFSVWAHRHRSGGIKPCVSAHVGDQFGESNSHLRARCSAGSLLDQRRCVPLDHDAVVPGVVRPAPRLGIPGVLMCTPPSCSGAGGRSSSTCRRGV